MSDSKHEIQKPMCLFISEHFDEEPFFKDLQDLGYPLKTFSREKGGWIEENCPGIYLLHEKLLLQEFSHLLDIFFMAPESRPVIVIGEQVSSEYLAGIFPDRPFFYLNKPIGMKLLSETIQKCVIEAEKGKIKREFERELEHAQSEIKTLRAIGLALSAERDQEKLLQMILLKSREIAEADAASLYLVESEKSLRFKLTQNVSFDWQMSENRLIPIDDKSLAGYVALTGQTLNLLDAYFLPAHYPFTFNRSFDLQSTYRTKSMIVVPMKNQAGEILGVIQLINKRSDFETLRPGKKLQEEYVIPFSRNDLELLQAVASQAAIALENNKLYEDIKNLFEGFVRASIVAIESRDPTTCGHSERVAALTVAFARKLTDHQEGEFANVTFDDKALTEIRYASLLHDFGKVGVREEVLIKARKLFPHELEMLRWRFRFIRKSLEADFFKECYDMLLARGKETFEMIRPSIEANFQAQLQELDGVLDFLTKANEPTILEEGNFNRLIDIAQLRYRDRNGDVVEYLSQREIQVLSIRKGSLSEAERLEIESHVTHTFNFLSKIPWTRNLRRVPEIAFAHHEKLNGRGYPNHLEAKAIPLESKLMTISDIFDALTARDRPYKKALPYERAFDIMYNEVKQGLIPKDLLDLFVDAQVYKVINDFVPGRG